MVQKTCGWEKEKKKKANKELERNGKMGCNRVWEKGRELIRWIDGLRNKMYE